MVKLPIESRLAFVKAIESNKKYIDYVNDFIKFFFTRKGPSFSKIEKILDLKLLDHGFFRNFSEFLFFFADDLKPMLTHEVPSLESSSGFSGSAFFDSSGQLAFQFVNLSKIFSFFLDKFKIKLDTFYLLMSKHRAVFYLITERLIEDLLCKTFVNDSALINSSFIKYIDTYHSFFEQFNQKNYNFILKEFYFNLLRLKLYDSDIFFFKSDSFYLNFFHKFNLNSLSNFYNYNTVLDYFDLDDFFIFILSKNIYDFFVKKTQEAFNLLFAELVQEGLEFNFSLFSFEDFKLFFKKFSRDSLSFNNFSFSDDYFLNFLKNNFNFYDFKMHLFNTIVDFDKFLNKRLSTNKIKLSGLSYHLSYLLSQNQLILENKLLQKQYLLINKEDFLKNCHIILHNFLNKECFVFSDFPFRALLDNFEFYLKFLDKFEDFTLFSNDKESLFNFKEEWFFCAAIVKLFKLFVLSNNSFFNTSSTISFFFNLFFDKHLNFSFFEFLKLDHFKFKLDFFFCFIKALVFSYDLPYNNGLFDKIFSFFSNSLIFNGFDFYFLILEVLNYFNNFIYQFFIKLNVYDDFYLFFLFKKALLNFLQFFLNIVDSFFSSKLIINNIQSSIANYFIYFDFFKFLNINSSKSLFKNLLKEIKNFDVSIFSKEEKALLKMNFFLHIQFTFFIKKIKFYESFWKNDFSNFNQFSFFNFLDHSVDNSSIFANQLVSFNNINYFTNDNRFNFVSLNSLSYSFSSLFTNKLVYFENFFKNVKSSFINFFNINSMSFFYFNFFKIHSFFKYDFFLFDDFLIGSPNSSTFFDKENFFFKVSVKNFSYY